MIDIVASWSLVAKLGLVAFALLGIVGLAIGVRWAIRRWQHGRAQWYPDQPTIPVLFHPEDSSPPAKGEDWSPRWRPRPPFNETPDDVGLIGRRHGPPKEQAPLSTSRTTVAEVESDVGPPSRPEDHRPRSTRANAERTLGDQGSAAPESAPDGSRPPEPDVAERPAAEDDDRTLQLLPGRMEVVAGGLRGREIRFVRTPGDTYTFGRQSGTDPSHIHLDNATVSRHHASMRFANGRWRIRNLSQTNPLRINGELADTPRREYTLHDGDRVEMGEVAFLFRER